MVEPTSERQGPFQGRKDITPWVTFAVVREAAAKVGNGFWAAATVLRSLRSDRTRNVAAAAGGTHRGAVHTRCSRVQEGITPTDTIKGFGPHATG